MSRGLSSLRTSSVPLVTAGNSYFGSFQLEEVLCSLQYKGYWRLHWLWPVFWRGIYSQFQHRGKVFQVVKRYSPCRRCCLSALALMKRCNPIWQHGVEVFVSLMFSIGKQTGKLLSSRCWFTRPVVVVRRGQCSRRLPHLTKTSIATSYLLCFPFRWKRQGMLCFFTTILWALLIERRDDFDDLGKPLVSYWFNNVRITETLWRAKSEEVWHAKLCKVACLYAFQ